MGNFKFEPHSMTGKVCGKTYCVKCGLVSLNNEISAWCVEKGCNSEAHPSYKIKLSISSKRKS